MRPQRAVAAAWLVVLTSTSAGCIKPVPYPVIGVKPESPLVRHNPSVLAPIVPAAESRHPTLRWEARAGDGTTYDLRMWRGEPNVPGELIYARDALVGAVHTVEIELEPATLYLWTLRERRFIDGQSRVSDWAVLRMDIYGRDDQRRPDIPHPGYFRFTTPK
jgi:hypothetical protein